MRNSLRTRLFSPRLVSGLVLALVYVAPQQAAQSPTPAAQACAVSGVVQSGAVVLPGVSVAALGSDGAEIAATSTEQNGSYVLRVTGPGTYNIRVSLAAFAATTREVTLTAAECRGRLDVSLTLASRAPAPAASSPAASAASASKGAPAAAAAPPASSNPTQTARGAGAGRGAQAGASATGRGRGGFQQLDVVANSSGETAAASTEDAAANLRAELQLPPGFSTDAPTETVATAGIQGQSNDAVLFGGRGGRGEFGEGGPEGRGGEGGFGEQAGFGGGG